MTDYTVTSGDTSTGITLQTLYSSEDYPYYSPYPDGGDTQEVLSGGTAKGIVVDAGAVQTISAGGAASGTVLEVGTDVVFEETESTNLLNGAMLVDAGGTADSTMVGAGTLSSTGAYYGSLNTSSGNSAGFTVEGTATNTTISTMDNMLVTAGGVATGVADNSGGATYYTYEGDENDGDPAPVTFGLSVGGAASGVVIGSTGSEAVQVGGVTTGTVINGGVQSVSGTADATILNTGLSSISGTANDTSISGGTQTVGTSGIADATTVSGGTQIVSGGTANGTVVNSGAESVNGGVSNNVTVNGGGSEIVGEDEPSYNPYEGSIGGGITIGTVSGLTLDGGYLSNAGVVQSIAGSQTAVSVVSGGNIGNASTGTISATGFGIHSDAGGSTTIDNSGTIVAGTAIALGDGGTITNSGTIDGTGGMAIAGVTHLVVDAGQVIDGSVTGIVSSILELGTGTGTLGGLGSQYTGFGTVQVDAGQTWTLSGSSTLGNGVTLDLGAGSTLVVAGGALTDSGAGTIAFQGVSQLALDAGTTGLTVTGFAAPDTITFSNIAYATADTVNVVGNTVTVAEANGVSDSVAFARISSENFALASVSGGATELTVKPVVTAIVAHPDASGTLAAGNVITFDLTPSMALTTTTTSGVPSLGLSDGGTATYDETASNSTTLVFRTTVTAGENTADLMVSGLSFGGSTIVDAQGSPLDLTSVAGLAGSDTGIAISTTPSGFPDTAAPLPPTGLALAAASDSGIAGDGITNVATPTLTGTAEAGSTVSLYDNGGTVAVGSGTASSTGSWSVTGSLVAGANSLTATATDPSGDVSAQSSSLVVTLDDTVPTVAALVATASAMGPLSAGSVVTFTLTLSAALSINLAEGSPTLALSDGGIALYVAAASLAGALVFQSTVVTGQNAADLQVTGLSLNGAVIQDVAGNSLDGTTVPTLAGSNTGLVIDTNPVVVPTPTPTPVLGVTTMAGADGGTVFTTATGGANTVTATATGNDVVNSRGTDTINAGGGSDIVFASGSAATVNGGAGSLTFVAGAGNYTAGGGQATDILYGGNGQDVLTGGAGANSIIVAGFGNTSLVGGVGSSVLMFGGFGANVFTGSTGGADTMVGGDGANTFNMTNNDIAFGGANGPDTFYTGSGTSLIVEGPGTTNVILGSGMTTDFGGTGSDTYTVAEGLGAIADIVGFKASDHLDLTGGFTQADATSAVNTATTGSFGTTLNLSDGTKINLFGVSVAASQVSVV